MFKRKSRSDEVPRYEQLSEGVRVYPPGERVFHERDPAKPLKPGPGNGPLDTGPPPVTIISGRHRREVLR